MKRSAITAKATTGRVGRTDDDREDIFEPLTRYGFLPTKHLVAFGTRNPVTTRGRLKKYHHETEKWPLKKKPIIRHVDALRYSINTQAQYRRGPAIYSDLGMDEYRDRIEKTIIGPHFNDHDILLNCAVADIELSVKKAGLRFISHLELLDRAPRNAREAKSPFTIPVPKIQHGKSSEQGIFLCPDALFGIEYREGTRFFAVELDRGTETVWTSDLKRTSWLRKILCYEGMDKSYLGIPKLHVLCLFPAVRRHNKLSRIDMVKRAIQAASKNPELFCLAEAKPIGAFSRIPAPDDYYFNLEWQREGHPPLKLGEV